MGKQPTKKKWYEDHEEIAGIVTRGKEHNLSTFTFGPYEWHLDFEQLLQLVEGNEKFVNDVRAELEKKNDETGTVGPRTWQRVKAVRLLRNHVREKENIAVVFDQGAAVTLVLGPIGKADWAHTMTMRKDTLSLMAEML